METEESESDESETELRASAKQGLGPDLIAGSGDEAESSDEDNMSVDEVCNILERNHMYVDIREAAIRGQMLVKKAKEITDERRASEMTGEEADNIVEALQFYSTKVKQTRFCEKNLPLGEEETPSPDKEIEAAHCIQKTWQRDDRLRTSWDAEFFADTLPEIATPGDPSLDQLLAKVPRVAKPAPDVCIRAFSERVLAVLQEFKCKLIAAQWVSFFALDAQGADGPIAVAVNQCCRRGAATVKNCRAFFEATKAR